MRKIINIVFILFIFLFEKENSKAQVNTSLTDYYLLDFSVPDIPAFKALGTDPSNILRPSDIQKFSAAFAPFYTNKQGVIPKNFALEFAPWKLASKDWTLRQYSGCKKHLYNTSFSLGTIRDTLTNSSKLSVGARISFITKSGDILNAVQDTNLSISAITNLQTDAQLKVVELRSIWRQFYQNQFQSFDAFINELNHNKTILDTNMNVAGKWYYLLSLLKVKSLPDSSVLASGLFQLFKKNVVDSILNNFKDSNWNARRFDLAVAWVGASPDTLIKNSYYYSFNIWATLALKVGKNGQLLVGGNIILPRTEKSDKINTKVDYSANLRFYLGVSDVRGFVEGEYKYKNFDELNNALLFNLGAEFRLMDDFWVVATGGINNYIGEDDPFSKFVSSIDLRYSFNKPAKKNR